MQNIPISVSNMSRNKFYELRGPNGKVVIRHFSLDRILDAAIVLVKRDNGQVFTIK